MFTLNLHTQTTHCAAESGYEEESVFDFDVTDVTDPTVTGNSSATAAAYTEPVPTAAARATAALLARRAHLRFAL
jgi:hypothetical protein